MSINICLYTQDNFAGDMYVIVAKQFSWKYRPTLGDFTWRTAASVLVLRGYFALFERENFEGAMRLFDQHESIAALGSVPGTRAIGSYIACAQPFDPYDVVDKIRAHMHCAVAMSV